jgi:hypothetical protein
VAVDGEVAGVISIADAALMQADVGIPIGAGTDIAIESSDVILIGDRLSAVVDGYHICGKSYAKTVQNLVFAFAFHAVGVPLATTGLVHPVWAMIAMAASVTTVLLNSFGGRLLPGRAAPQEVAERAGRGEAVKRRPIAPPRPASTSDSARNCRMRRRRPAPTARRTASSRRRPAVRASSTSKGRQQRSS